MALNLPSMQGCDSDMLCYPDVFACDDEVCLLFKDNDFGRHGCGIAVLD